MFPEGHDNRRFIKGDPGACLGGQGGPSVFFPTDVQLVGIRGELTSCAMVVAVRAKVLLKSRSESVVMILRKYFGSHFRTNLKSVIYNVYEPN
jgi:hypothetical protein